MSTYQEELLAGKSDDIADESDEIVEEKDNRQVKKQGSSRRNFLRNVAVGVVGAGASLTLKDKNRVQTQFRRRRGDKA